MLAEPLSPVRQSILLRLLDLPGESCTDLAHAFGIDHSTAAYHLRRLERAGLVTASVTGRAILWYPVGCGICPFLRPALPLLRDPRYASLLARSEAPGVRVSEMTSDPRQTARIRSRFERLEALGLVAKRDSLWIATPKTAVCRERARASGACDLWGRCEVSRAKPEPAEGTA